VRAGERPANDYWTTLIPAIKAKHREFKFIAEAYWDLEWELQQQGFDYCYDKKLYDRMERADAKSVRQHLLTDFSYQEKMVRFIENLDEPRAAATFSPGKERAAAVAMLTLMGAKLLVEMLRFPSLCIVTTYDSKWRRVRFILSTDQCGRRVRDIRSKSPRLFRVAVFTIFTLCFD
jgi:hypothetical protein